jgi:predicted kinase
MNPLLIAMAGLPGTGKSTLAAALAAALPTVLLDKDKLRAGLIPADRIEYSRAQDDYVFELLLKAAKFNLDRGRAVILDGRTFTRRYQVDRLQIFAAEFKANLKIIECICPEELALVRLQGDLQTGEHPAGNRTPELYKILKAEIEQIVPDHIVVDTSCDLNTCLRKCVEYLEIGPQNL